ncbi:DUF1360 domain-containing protein [Allokutzneria multivorans]|uniref:DUF1360 domain-containing protein n=1 Tax=Allokutzneria multivorans TaxID=1142134 RepID=A0ABP7U4I2_9PSEU
MTDSYRDGEDIDLHGYAASAAVFTGLTAAVVLAARRGGRRLPERIRWDDLALLGSATHKASRMLSKERVTSFLRAPFTRYQGPAGSAEVAEQPRGRGWRRTVGELLTCPFCVGTWTAGGFVAGLVLAPRPTRVAASVLTVLTVSDWLQLLWTITDEKAREQ